MEIFSACAKHDVKRLFIQHDFFEIGFYAVHPTNERDENSDEYPEYGPRFDEMIVGYSGRVQLFFILPIS